MFTLAIRQGLAYSAYSEDVDMSISHRLWAYMGADKEKWIGHRVDEVVDKAHNIDLIRPSLFKL